MPYYGMLRLTALVGTDVMTNVVPSSPILVTLMMEALSCSETSVNTRATQNNIAEDGILQNCGFLSKAELHEVSKFNSTFIDCLLQLCIAVPFQTGQPNCYCTVSLNWSIRNSVQTHPEEGRMLRRHFPSTLNLTQFHAV
jgi:hypothetical protein